MTKICSFAVWQSQKVFPVLTDNHHFPECVRFSSARRYFASSEAGGVDLDQFLEWFFGSDYSFKTNIMLRSSGNDYHLIDNSVVLKCFPEQQWKTGFTTAFILKACSLAAERAACWCCRRVVLSYGGHWQRKTQHACERAQIEAALVAAQIRLHFLVRGWGSWPGIVHGRPSAEYLLFKTGLVYFPPPSLLLSRP